MNRQPGGCADYGVYAAARTQGCQTIIGPFCDTCRWERLAAVKAAAQVASLNLDPIFEGVSMCSFEIGSGH